VSLKKLVLALASVASAGLLTVVVVAVNRTNPPSTGNLSAPSQVDATLRRACYDCHSNQTHWPWYSRVAPLSWLIVRDVTLARKEVNFSEWGGYYAIFRRRKLQWIGRSLRQENMPPWSYLFLHPGARLTETDRVKLKRWIEYVLASPSTERARRWRNFK
jgi:hypothetical protein